MTPPVNSLQPPPASEESIAGAEDPGAFDTMSMLGSAARIATQLPNVARAGLQLAGDLLRVAAGSSDVQPARNDWRFANPTWAENPLYRRRTCPPRCIRSSSTSSSTTASRVPGG
jgi:polyhydroxyalkanoate synthase